MHTHRPRISRCRSLSLYKHKPNRSRLVTHHTTNTKCHHHSSVLSRSSLLSLSPRVQNVVMPFRLPRASHLYWSFLRVVCPSPREPAILSSPLLLSALTPLPPAPNTGSMRPSSDLHVFFWSPYSAAGVRAAGASRIRIKNRFMPPQLQLFTRLGRRE